MQSSMFNVRVPLPERNEVFLMNTFTDAQIVVSPEVVELLDGLGARPAAADTLTGPEREAVTELAAHGFIVRDRDSERETLEQFFRDLREDTSQLRVTVLTTLQCNFACDYCFQGDHGDHNKFANKMSLETADGVIAWIEDRLDAVQPGSLVLTFFGGEPLLNLPVMYRMAERVWEATQARGVKLLINVITNGLLLTPEVVDRLAPYGLNGVKVTLDGDRDVHDRMRPLRGGQGTFDRIVENVRQVAGRVRVSIGGNFDESSADSIPGLMQFLAEQEFADKLAQVNFKPIIQSNLAPAQQAKVIALTPVAASGKPVGLPAGASAKAGGNCMTSAGAGSGASCSSCHSLDDQMVEFRRQAKTHGFPTVDGVHMGPCELHKRHAYTVGPEGALYACPGFTGEPGMAVGHIDDRLAGGRERIARRFDVLGPWRECGDCAFIPVCAGGCAAASHSEQGAMERPTCHLSGFERSVEVLAREVAAAS